ncbi:uncharacterized protein LOC135481897 [Liolophura sinensis]|uniref:uncharacterized protein LOC135481897 n=1 Tax=Liolophura sinensis TaxID=3198878 RepID=UPI003157FA55
MTFYLSEGGTGSLVGPLAGGVAGGLVLIAVIILVIVIVLRRRSSGAGGAGGKDEKTSVNEQLVGGSEKSAFSDPRWRQADAEVAENDLYGGSPFPTKLPPQDKRPPKPVRTFEHNSIGEPSHSTAPKDGGQQLEMVENTMYASVDPKTKSQKNGATKPKKGKPVTPAKPSKPAKTQVPIDDSYEVTDFTNTASGTNNNNPTVARTQQLNYPEVSFENKKKTPKTDPAASPTEYASIRFRKP